AALIGLASRGQVDAARLDDYVRACLSEPKQALLRLRAELWRVNLIPDQRVLDTDQAVRRLKLNMQIRQLLLTPADSPSDITRLSRLREAADQGDAGAKAALQYRDTRSTDLL